jgi:hypothetical protein
METTPSLTVRINLKTYNRLKRKFKPLKDESVVSYFERLSKFIEDYQNGRTD